MSLWRYIDAEVWSDPWFHTLDPDLKLVFFWLVTNPRILPCGVIETTESHITFDTGVDKVDLSSLEPKVQQVWRDGGIWLFVVNFHRRQRGHTNAINADKRAAASLRRCPIPVRGFVLKEYPELGPHINEEEEPEHTPHRAIVYALAQAEGREKLTRNDWSRLGKVAKALLEEEATVEQVNENAFIYADVHPDWELTADALLKWWSAIPSWTKKKAVTKVKPGLASALLAEAMEDGAEAGEVHRGRPVRGLPGQ